MTTSGTSTARATAGGRVLAGGRGVVPAVLRGGGTVAAVWRLSGPMAVLCDHAYGHLRGLRSPAPGHLAGVRVAVGLPGPPPGDPGRPGDGRGGVRIVPGGGRCRAAVRRPGAARCGRRHRDQRAGRRADRPATPGQQARAGGHHRRRHVRPGRGGLGTSALVQYGPAPTHLVWWLLLGADLAAAAAVLAMPETTPGQPGVLASLRPW